MDKRAMDKRATDRRAIGSQVMGGTGLPGRGEPGSTLSDASMDAAMGRLLQVGVLVASATVLTGGLLYLRANAERPAAYRNFTREPASLRNGTELVRAIGHGDPTAIIQLGVLLLIATPVARVVFAAVAFTMQRDRLYMGISVAVLGILLAGLFWLR